MQDDSDAKVPLCVTSKTDLNYKGIATLRRHKTFDLSNDVNSGPSNQVFRSTGQERDSVIIIINSIFMTT